MEASATTTQEKTGLFPVAYRIGNGLPGGVTLTVHLLVNTPSHAVTGIGNVSQAINPPLNQDSRLDGDFTYMTVMPNQSNILVVATGYPNFNWPPHGGIGPVLTPNLHLRMVLNKDWQSGTANFQYLLNGEWKSVDNAPVKIITP